MLFQAKRCRWNKAQEPSSLKQVLSRKHKINTWKECKGEVFDQFLDKGDVLSPRTIGE